MKAAATANAPIGRCKGTLLVNLRSFVVSEGGDSAWERLVDSASVEDARLLRQQLLVSSQYPVGVWNRVLHAHLDRKPDASAVMLRYARHVASRDLSTVLKFVLSIATPDGIVARTSMFWSRYFDTGSVTPTKVAPQEWTLAIAGPTDEDQGPGAATCGDGVTGWVEQALKLAGAKSPTITHVRCRFQGARVCTSTVRW